MHPSQAQYQILAEQQKSHHAEAFRKRLQDGTVEAWLDPDNADYWGNSIVWKALEAPFRLLTKRMVLTVGDGKGGKEAVFFKALGHDVTATDICTDVLAEARKRGLIDSFACADAEKLPFDDQSYDIVATKETLHHLPRPYVALYEMLRVAREGVVIAEPHFRHSSCAQVGLIWCIRRVIRRLLLGRDSFKPHPLPPSDYEPSGNYVFQFNPYELTQIARAMGLSAAAFGYAHMYYEKGCELIKGEPLRKFIEQKTREFAAADAKCGIEARPMLVALMWKQAMPDDFAGYLEKAQFKIVPLNKP